jgi:hypothetical protein
MLPRQQDKETGKQVPLYELSALFLNPLMNAKNMAGERKL